MTEQLAIIYVPVDSLTPYARNSRTHSAQQVAQIAASLVEFGWTTPISVDGTHGIIAGHARVMAAKQLGMTEVPVVELGHLTEVQKRAYVIADNQLALQAGWDEELLHLELSDLQDADFDLSLLGFGDDELADLLAGLETSAEGETEEDEVPDAPETPVSKPGDVWLCGNHRVLCGDATELASYTLLMAGQKAKMCFTDPPYNVDYANSAKDKMRGTDRPILNDDLGDAFGSFLQAALTPMLQHCAGSCYIAMSSSELDALQSLTAHRN
jgi:hypothetical protein